MASPTAVGSLIAGRYRVMERLGSGGMAVVYLAEDERLGRRVAVKRLHTGSPEDTAKRFGREARLGASLNHPNVATVYDTVTADDSVVIVMEYVDGESLADALPRGPLEPAEVVRILRGVADALDHAHDHGIVHRDVKPANILLGRDGAVKLVDLGIATAVEGTRITSSGNVMGTAAYMAPEQLDGSQAGPATDVYALAAVAYEMLTGRPAYRGATPVEVAHQVVSGPPPDLADAWPDAPPGASEAVGRGLAFDPSARPGSALAFVDSLSDAIGAVPGAQQGPPATAALPLHEHPGAPRRSARALFVPLAALLAVVVVGGILALVFLGGGEGDKEGSSPSSSASERQARADRRQARRERAARQREQEAQPAPAPESPSGGSSSYAIPQPSGNSPAEGSRLQLQGYRLLDADPDEAVAILERSVRAFPPGTSDIHLQYAYFSLGRGLRLAGRPEDAIPVLRLRLKNPDQRATVEAELRRAQQDAAG